MRNRYLVNLKKPIIYLYSLVFRKILSLFSKLLIGVVFLESCPLKYFYLYPNYQKKWRCKDIGNEIFLKQEKFV